MTFSSASEVKLEAHFPLISLKTCPCIRVYVVGGINLKHLSCWLPSTFFDLKYMT
jgi:hypothetical protein